MKPEKLRILPSKVYCTMNPSFDAGVPIYGVVFNDDFCYVDYVLYLEPDSEASLTPFAVLHDIYRFEYDEINWAYPCESIMARVKSSEPFFEAMRPLDEPLYVVSIEKLQIATSEVTYLVYLNMLGAHWLGDEPYTKILMETLELYGFLVSVQPVAESGINR
ncbi:MAG: hypothetical protein AAFU54_19855 [Chloroflexota bacterium]